MDASDKEIVGYKFSRFCHTDELLFTVNQAISTRFPNGVKDQGLTIRSDNGCQMTSRRYMKALKDAGIKQERTGYNNPDADAYIERFFRTLKEETVWLQEKEEVQKSKHMKMIGNEINNYLQSSGNMKKLADTAKDALENSGIRDSLRVQQLKDLSSVLEQYLKNGITPNCL